MDTHRTSSPQKSWKSCAVIIICVRREEIHVHPCKYPCKSVQDNASAERRAMEAAARPHFGALLRQFRLDAGMTQQDLAERAKLSVEAISLLERGARTRPRRETVTLLGLALALPPEHQALLGRAVGIPHPERQRESRESLNQSLLRVIYPDSQATPRHNLPQQLTSFVGRQREIGEIDALLRKHRLVTVVGSGGVGKTRISVKLASELLAQSPDGVWLIDLAPLTDQTLVASAVLTTLQ